MFGHYDEGVKLISAVTSVFIEGFEEEANVVLDNKESSALPG